MTDKFEDKYTLDAQYNYSGDESHEGVLETFGESLVTLAGIDPTKVWTVIEGDTEHITELFVVSGLATCNRLYYVITEESWPEAGIVYEY